MNHRSRQAQTIDIPWRLLAGLLLVSVVQGFITFTGFSHFTLAYFLVCAFDVLYIGLLAFLCFHGSPRLLHASASFHPDARAERRFIPALLGISILCFLPAAFLWMVGASQAHHEPTYPSLPHFASLAVYPLLIGAILLLPSQNLSRLSRARILLDSLIIMITLTTLYCYVALIPILVTAEGTLFQKAWGSFFTAIDLMVLFCLLLIALRTREHVLQQVIALLTLAVLICFIGHSVSLAFLLSTSSSLILRPNLGWLISLTLVAVAARMMSRVIQAHEREQQELPVLLEDTGFPSRWKIVLNTIPVLIFALLVLSLLSQRESAAFAARFVVVDIGGTLILLLLVLRQMLAMHEVNSLKQTLRQKNALLEQLATHDPLTGALNHRSFVEKLDHELASTREKQTACSILFLDIDHFKRINDQYGHLVGDLVLCQSAGVVAAILRAEDEEDCLGRWGGEEFVAILPGQDLPAACEVAEAIRRRVEQQVFVSVENLQVTCSLGIATYPQTATSRDDLVDAADQAMYIAKRRGRNQVYTAHQSGMSGHEVKPA